MGPISDDMNRAFIAMVIICVLAGVMIAIGLPWMWQELVKPLLIWLVL